MKLRILPAWGETRRLKARVVELEAALEVQRALSDELTRLLKHYEERLCDLLDTDTPSLGES